MSSRERNIVM